MFDSDYIFLGAFVLAVWWIAASIAVTLAAADCGHGGAWFFISVFLSPIFAVLLLIAYHVMRDSQYLPPVPIYKPPPPPPPKK